MFPRSLVHYVGSSEVIVVLVVAVVVAAAAVVVVCLLADIWRDVSAAAPVSTSLAFGAMISSLSMLVDDLFADSFVEDK